MSQAVIYPSFKEAMLNTGADAGCTVYPVSGGYQVVRITRCPSGMPGKYKPVAPRHMINPSCRPPKPATVEVQLAFLCESPGYIEVLFNGCVTWVKKTKAHSISICGDIAKLVVDKDYAEKRGFGA